MRWFQDFREVWALDFEFRAEPGERPAPRCMVGRELKSGRLVRRWFSSNQASEPQIGIGSDTLVIAYYASAELGCFMALDWPLPTRILDLFAEFRNSTNGKPVPCGNGLLGALAYFGLPAIESAEKESMRQLARRLEPYSESERLALLDYCQTDVDAIARLVPHIGPHIDFPRALLRGRYMAAAARMEWNGTPIDHETLQRLRTGWESIKRQLVSKMDSDGELFEPVGQRTIDPKTTLGLALLETAAEWGIDPHQLAEAVDMVWSAGRSELEEQRKARHAARKATGLSVQRIRNWERSGRDHSTWPELDVAALELAGSYPELGIGRGYNPDAPDEHDSADRLWNLLGTPESEKLPRHHPDILREAAEIVYKAGPCQQPLRPMRFSAAKFADYLVRHCIPWPMLATGSLALDDDTFREMAKLYPVRIGPIRELRYALSQLRLNELAVGPDSRNRLLLSAFQSRTGRNQPSNSRFIFGPSCWLRSLIQPEPGKAIAYVDWSGQEYGIAAALSGDASMQVDYLSGDPYLAFGKRIGAVPASATKKTHSGDRDRLKVCCGLGAMYGAGPATIARTLGIPECLAREWLRAHRETYSRYWRWSDSIVDEAMLTGKLRSVFGWTLHLGPEVNSRSVRNFPMQANGAEMMRLAACLLTERGIITCAPIHDAFLIEASEERIERTVEAAQQAMQVASEIVLPKFPLRTDYKIVRHPDRYTDPRGAEMWNKVQEILGETEDKNEDQNDVGNL